MKIGRLHIIALLWAVSMCSNKKCQDESLAIVVRHLQAEVTKMRVCLNLLQLFNFIKKEIFKFSNSISLPNFPVWK